MRIKRYRDFSLNESFGLSKELWGYISKNSLDTSELHDSLIELEDNRNINIQITRHIIDKEGHIIGINLDENQEYRVKYDLRIDYNLPSNGKIDKFYEIQEQLNSISMCIQEMIDRVSDRVILKRDNFKISESTIGQKEVVYNFVLEFLSEPINIEVLNKYYQEYKSRSTHFSPEFNDGIKKLTDHYRNKERIDLLKFLDTSEPENFDYIIVGFMTEDDIYGIADYDKQTKKFSIDWSEVEASIDWYRENYGFE